MDDHSERTSLTSSPDSTGTSAPSAPVTDADARPPRPASPPAVRSPTQGTWQYGCGSILIFLGGLLFIFERSGATGTPWWQRIGLMAAAVGMMLYGRRLYNRGRQFEALRTATDLADDPRPPVLYLRSFQDDATTAKVPLINPADPASSNASEEEQLAEVLRPLGPVIAIGEPGEALPDLGAKRIYVGDDAWQAQVQTWMRQAQLVVLRAGATHGLWWEVQQAAALVPPTRLLIVIPKQKDVYEHFRLSAQPFFPRPFPAEIALPSANLRSVFGVSYQSLGGFIFFQPDWTPQFLPMRRSSFGYGSQDFPLLPALQTTLQPVFTQLGMPIDLQRLVWRSRRRMLLIVLLVLAAVVGIWYFR